MRGLAAATAVLLAAGIFAVALAVSRTGDLLAPRPAPSPAPELADDVVDVRPAALDRPAPVAPPPPAAVTDLVADDARDDLRARNLLIPVAGVEAADLFKSFDELRGGTRRHEAIDILAPRHTPVVAVEDGTVARLFLSEAGGTTLYQFDPARRYVYYYAHLERYAPGMSEKDRVTRGQVIGFVGTSGNAPEGTPHLHFAIFRLTDAQRWWEGTPIDPFEVLEKGE
jgi:murein DD-endopeptidase MepM/ murein hydrolase activator NlpD